VFLNTKLSFLRYSRAIILHFRIQPILYHFFNFRAFWGFIAALKIYQDRICGERKEIRKREKHTRKRTKRIK
jgi:polyferredoxin